MLEALFGALVGGVIAIAGGEFARRMEKKHQTKAVALALYVELEFALDKIERKQAKEFYEFLLDQWIETGRIGDADFVVKMFELSQQERYPVYYSNVAHLGKLPVDISAKVVRFHALSSGLIESAKILLSSDISADHVSKMASNLKAKYAEMRQARKQAISGLSGFLGKIPQLPSPSEANKIADPEKT